MMNYQIDELYTGTSSNTPNMNENELEQNFEPSVSHVNDENCKVADPLAEINDNRGWTLEEIKEVHRLFTQWKPDTLNRDHIITAEQYVQAAINEGMVCVPKVCWDDVGSLKDLKQSLMLNLMSALKHRKEYMKLGLSVPSCVLLSGPPGCGKTMTARALANEARLNFIPIKIPELLNLFVADSVEALRRCFERAKNCAPCIIFIDEIEAMYPIRLINAENQAPSRIVMQLLTEIDWVNERKGVFVLAATNRPDLVDSAFLRPGRFDKIFYVGLPSAEDRVEILRTITRKGVPRLGADVDLEKIGRKLCGFSGADLAALFKEAAFDYVLNSKLENCDFTLTRKNFIEAMSKVTPSVSEQVEKFHEEMKNIFGMKY